MILCQHEDVTSHTCTSVTVISLCTPEHRRSFIGLRFVYSSQPAAPLYFLLCADAIVLQQRAVQNVKLFSFDFPFERKHRIARQAAAMGADSFTEQQSVQCNLYVRANSLAEVKIKSIDVALFCRKYPFVVTKQHGSIKGG